MRAKEARGREVAWEGEGGEQGVDDSLQTLGFSLLINCDIGTFHEVKDSNIKLTRELGGVRYPELFHLT